MTNKNNNDTTIQEQAAEELYHAYFVNLKDDLNSDPYRTGPHQEEANKYVDWFLGIVDDLPVWKMETTPYPDGSTYHVSARYLEATSSTNKYAIVVHGLFSNSRNVGPWARVFYDLGYHVVTPDLRGFGLSTDDPNRNLGILDSSDILRWAERIVHQDPNAEIVLMGYSLGSINVLTANSKNSLPNIKAVVSESSLSSLRRHMEISFLNRGYTKEFFAEVIEKFNVLLEQKQGIKLEDGLSESKIQNTSLPLLVMHGTADSVFNYSNAFRISSLPDNNIKPRFIVEGATHANLVAWGYDSYAASIKNFLNRVFTPQESKPPTSSITDTIEIGINKDYKLRQGPYSIIIPVSGKEVLNIHNFSRTFNIAIGDFDIIVPEDTEVYRPLTSYHLDNIDSMNNIVIESIHKSTEHLTKPFTVTLRAYSKNYSKISNTNNIPVDPNK